jgi:GNAT superfamily N-acetyltransferase
MAMDIVTPLRMTLFRVDCSPLEAGQLAAADELAEEFLGQSGGDALAADFAAYPELVIVLIVDGVVAGVAFGHPDGEHGATLDGITVDDAHTAHGVGSLLLARFERAAADAGYRDVNLGRHWEPDDLVLNIAAPEGYSPAVKAAIEQRLRASEVCCIFCKPIAR